MSVSPPKADICGATRDVRFGPIADIGERNSFLGYACFLVSFGLAYSPVSAADALWECRFGSKADICVACPLYPRKRTFAAQLSMSAKGHKRTWEDFEP
jgi:hypothetical protein